MMKLGLVILSMLGLGMTLVPSVLVMVGALSWQSHSRLMVLGMVLWFGSAPFWMKTEEH